MTEQQNGEQQNGEQLTSEQGNDEREQPQLPSEGDESAQQVDTTDAVEHVEVADPIQAAYDARHQRHPDVEATRP